MSNPPQDVASYLLKEGEVKMVRLHYNAETGSFLETHETIGYMVVRGWSEEYLVMVLTKKIQRSSIQTIEEESQMLSEVPCLTVIRG